MKAWQQTTHADPPLALSRVDIAAPEMLDGLVRIKVDAVALGLPDVFMCQGTYAYKPELPCVPGQEFVGEVLECPDGFDEFKAGDRVAGVSTFFSGQGSFAEVCLALPHSIYPVGDAIDDAQAAGFIIAYHTAYVGLVMRAGLKAGETVLVSGGAGGTGSAAIQLATALGAQVIAMASSEAKRQVCRDCGAQAVIDPAEGDFVAQVRAATGGAGVDMVFDPVGGEFYERCFSVLKHQGRVLPIGFASGRWGDTPMGKVVQSNLSVIGALPAGFSRSEQLAAHAELVKLLEQRKIHCLVDDVIDFEEIPQGLMRVANREVTGRVIARVSN